MRVGVYIDGYNLYYGARGICGRSTSGWRWLNLRTMAEGVIAARSKWSGVVIENLTYYCTARISSRRSSRRASASLRHGERGCGVLA